MWPGRANRTAPKIRKIRLSRMASKIQPLRANGPGSGRKRLKAGPVADDRTGPRGIRGPVGPGPGARSGGSGLAAEADRRGGRGGLLVPVAGDRPPLLLAGVVPEPDGVLAELPVVRGRPAVDLGREVDLPGLGVEQVDAQGGQLAD